jgi:L-ribulose-5-phosphate 3-epimerase
MSQNPRPTSQPAAASGLSRRELLAYSAAFGSSFLAAQGLIASESSGPSVPPPARKGSSKRYAMKKSINLWALPYPKQMTLKECLELCKAAGFEGVELNYALDGDLSPEASDQQIAAVGELVRKIGLEISGLCSFLFWPYSLTHEDPQRRARGLELAEKMIHAAHLLQTPNLLVVPGAVYVPWLPEDPPVPSQVAYQRATEAVRRLIPQAEKAGVFLNLENIFLNGFLFSPQELAAFIDSFQSPQVRAHFDTGNIMQYQFPEDWIPILGKRIQNIHLKEASKKVRETTIDTFRPLLDGTVNWPAVLEALDQVGYRGYLTFEYFNPFRHWPEALVYYTSDALDRMLGRTS